MENGIKLQYHKINAIYYQSVWDFQQQLHDRVKQDKRRRRQDDILSPYLGHMIMCEHRPVFTMGKRASMQNLLLDEKSLADRGIELFEINRGGDITYHGPGQLTGYMIMDLALLYRDLHLYIRNLEEVIIRTLSDYDLIGMRIPDYTGVWIERAEKRWKICAIGVHMSRWVSMHGFGFNVNTDLSYFKHIVPCGIEETDKGITSLAQELNRRVDTEEVEQSLKKHVSEVFGLQIINI